MRLAHPFRGKVSAGLRAQLSYSASLGQVEPHMNPSHSSHPSAQGLRMRDWPLYGPNDLRFAYRCCKSYGEN